MHRRRRRPDAFDALGALTIATGAVLGAVALATRPPELDRILEARTSTVILAPITVIGTGR